MKNYYAQFVVGIDAVLLVLTVALSVIIIFYALIKQRVDNTRYRHMRDLMSKLQSLASMDTRTLLSGCVSLIKQTTSFELFDIVKHTDEIFPERFSKQFTECINNSGKTAEVERIARLSRNKWRRIEAMLMAGYLESPHVLDILKDALQDKDEDIAYFSLLALGHIKNAGSAKILLGAVKGRAFSGYKIASILEQFPPSLVETLIESINDEDLEVRFWVIKLLSRFKPAQYTREIGSLADDVSADVRAAVCECLGGIGGAGTPEIVKKYLKDDKWFVRMHAARSLEKILGPHSIPDVAPLIKDRHWFVRENVKEIMIKHFSEARAFIEKFLSEADEDVKRACAEIIDNATKGRQAGA